MVPHQLFTNVNTPAAARIFLIRADSVILDPHRRVLHLLPHPEWHMLFEALGYTAGLALYRRARRIQGDVITDHQRWHVLAAAVLGALVGSRVLDIAYELPAHPVTWWQAVAPVGGKTIVGGLLGAWLAVELIKKLEGIRTRTGDLFAIPLCVGIAIGRIGCLLAGLAEDTYGNATTLPWGIEFGDGIARHPTQAYEILFCVALAAALRRFQRRVHADGAIFRSFLAAYLGWRLLIDFLKPGPILYGMSVIQWSCLAGLLLSFVTWPTRQGHARLTYT